MLDDTAPYWRKQAYLCGTLVPAGQRAALQAVHRDVIGAGHPAGSWNAMPKADRDAARRAFQDGASAERILAPLTWSERERIATEARVARRLEGRTPCACGAEATIFAVGTCTWMCAACHERGLEAFRATPWPSAPIAPRPVTAPPAGRVGSDGRVTYGTARRRR
jgi:hypothetical protein